MKKPSSLFVRRGAAELALPTDQHREHHRGDHPDARVEQETHDDGRERHGHELRVDALWQVRDGRRGDDHDEEHGREQQHRAH